MTEGKGATASCESLAGTRFEGRRDQVSPCRACRTGGALEAGARAERRPAMRQEAASLGEFTEIVARNLTGVPADRARSSGQRSHPPLVGLDMTFISSDSGLTGSPESHRRARASGEGPARGGLHRGGAHADVQAESRAIDQAAAVVRGAASCPAAVAPPGADAGHAPIDRLCLGTPVLTLYADESEFRRAVRATRRLDRNRRRAELTLLGH